jgi:hypothetical protein
MSYPWRVGVNLAATVTVVLKDIESEREVMHRLHGGSC